MELQFSTEENLQATIEERGPRTRSYRPPTKNWSQAMRNCRALTRSCKALTRNFIPSTRIARTKSIELTEARNDVENLLASSRIGTLLLDARTCGSRNYSPQFAEVFNLVEGTLVDRCSIVAQPARLRCRGRWPRKSHQHECTIEHEARNVDSLVSGAGQPYRIGNQTVAGVIITLTGNN